MELDRETVPHPACLNTNYIVATFSDPRTQDFDQQSPNPFSEQMLSCRQDEVANCYRIVDGEFQLRFQMRSVLTKAAHRLSVRDRFTVTIDKAPFVLHGMNFAGRLLISHRDGTRRLIFLPGYLTYDPCGVSNHSIGHEFLTSESALFIQSVVAAQVKAAKEGAPEDFMDALHKVHKEANDLYVSRPYLMRWMTDQVIFACFPKGGPQRIRSYPKFILDLVGNDNLDLNEAGRGHTKEYLEWYLRSEQKRISPQNIRPPYQYYLALRQKLPENELKENVRDRYEKVITAAEQKEPGQGVFLKLLPRCVILWETQSRGQITFEELRTRCEEGLKEYQENMKRVDEEIITEVELMKKSNRNGEKCSVF